MTTALHKDLSIAEIHAPISFEYANQAARDGATGLTADDIRKFAWQTDNDSFWMLKNHSPVTWTQVSGGSGPIFGTQYSLSSSEGESSHTGDSNWQLKLTLGLSNLPTGKYRFEWYYEWKYDDAGAAWFGGRVQINDTLTVHELYQEPQDVANWHSENGFYEYEVSEGPEFVQVDIDYKTYVILATAYVRRARLVAWRVS